MPLRIYRLRRLLAATAVLLTAVVVGMYFYARSKATNVLKSIPNKMGVDIKQTANGFQISKSDGKRTLFTVQASSVKQFKLNGNAELHNGVWWEYQAAHNGLIRAEAWDLAGNITRQEFSPTRFNTIWRLRLPKSRRS